MEYGKSQFFLGQTSSIRTQKKRRTNENGDERMANPKCARVTYAIRWIERTPNIRLCVNVCCTPTCTWTQCRFEHSFFLSSSISRSFCAIAFVCVWMCFLFCCCAFHCTTNSAVFAFCLVFVLFLFVRILLHAFAGVCWVCVCVQLASLSVSALAFVCLCLCVSACENVLTFINHFPAQLESYILCSFLCFFHSILSKHVQVVDVLWTENKWRQCAGARIRISCAFSQYTIVCIFRLNVFRFSFFSFPFFLSSFVCTIFFSPFFCVFASTRMRVCMCSECSQQQQQQQQLWMWSCE